VFQELLKLVVNCVTSSDIAEDLHLAGHMTGKLAVELLHVRFLFVFDFLLLKASIVYSTQFITRLSSTVYLSYVLT